MFPGDENLAVSLGELQEEATALERLQETRVAQGLAPELKVRGLGSRVGMGEWDGKIYFLYIWEHVNQKNVGGGEVVDAR